MGGGGGGSPHIVTLPYSIRLAPKAIVHHNNGTSMMNSS